MNTGDIINIHFSGGQYYKLKFEFKRGSRLQNGIRNSVKFNILK
jgi:hypothetical protein